MAKYDVEMFLSDLQSYLNSSLNTKLSAIDSEKADSITLKQVDSSAYILQTMDGSVPNYDPYVFYGIQDIESTGIGPATANRYTIVVALILADALRDTTIAKRMLRYQRALSEVVQERYADIGDSFKAKIQNLVPIALTDMDTSNAYRGIGVSIEVTIA